jgi:hypothetical protein
MGMTNPVTAGIVGVAALTVGIIALHMAFSGGATEAQRLAAGSTTLADAMDRAANSTRNFQSAIGLVASKDVEVIQSHQALIGAKKALTAAESSAGPVAQRTAQQREQIRLLTDQVTVSEDRYKTALGERAKAHQTANGVSQGDLKSRKDALSTATEEIAKSQNRVNWIGKSAWATQNATSIIKGATEDQKRYNTIIGQAPAVAQAHIKSLNDQKAATTDPSVKKAIDSRIQGWKDYAAEAAKLKPIKIKAPTFEKMTKIQVPASTWMTPKTLPAPTIQKPKTPKVDPLKVTADTNNADTQLSGVKERIEWLTGQTWHVKVQLDKSGSAPQPPGGFRGGYVAGYAMGGKVRGPAGRDVIPAMLTAGEVVLTKQQQRLVDSGMSVRDAIVKTGGAFGRGGQAGKKEKQKSAASLGYAAGFRKQKKGEKANDYKSARTDYAKSKRDEQMGSYGSARTAFATAVKTNLGRQITEKYQGGTTGIGSMETKRREQDKQNKDFEKGFTGTVANIGQGIGDFSGSFRQFDKMQSDSNRTWERGWTGTIKKIDGSTFSGGFKDFDKQVEAGRKAIESQYDALTASESALKSLNDTAASDDLASNLSDAQGNLDMAKQFGNAKEIADAQKAVGKAQLDVQRADLEKKAGEERTAADAAKATALSQYDEKAALDRQALQDSFDDQKALRDIAFQDARDQLQQALDDQLQSRRDSDALVLAGMQLQQDQEQTMLDNKMAVLEEHWAKVNNLTAGQAKLGTSILNQNARDYAVSGETLITELGNGIKKGGPKLKDAVVSIGKLIKDYLKLNSPAKKGPLSTIDGWFNALGPTLASGMDMSAVESNLNSLATPTVGGARGGSAGGVSISLTVNDSTLSGMSRDQADRVARDIQAAIARQVSFTI